MWKKYVNSLRKKKTYLKKTKKLFFCAKNSKSLEEKKTELKQKRKSFFLWKTTVIPLRKEKKNVRKKRKLRFKDMRQGFAAREKTHVLCGGSLL